MRILFQIFSLVLITCIGFAFSVLHAFAESPDRFEVILSKEEANANEALDLTITAVYKSGEVKKDYTGDILVFSESDIEAEFPNELKENSYTFSLANEGSMKFENAVKFKTAGTQNVYVYDLNDETILGLAEVMVIEKQVQTSAEIILSSPENGMTLAKDNLIVSGSTNKNHKVRIMLDSTTEFETTSNNEGIFEQEITDLSDGNHTFQAFVLNADEDVIGQSVSSNVKINSTLPMLKNLTLTPAVDVETGSQMNVEVVATKNLSEVTVIVNDVLHTLKEGKDGIYETTIVAPAEVSEYQVDVKLKDEFAHETVKNKVSSFNTVSSLAKKVEVEIPKNSAPEEVKETAPEEESIDLEVKNIQVTELKTKSVITWDKVEAAESYNIYKKMSNNDMELIDNVTTARYEIEITGDVIKYDDFAIKALGRNSQGELMNGDFSEMTKVKTGPELYIILAIVAIMLTAGIAFFRREA